MSAWIVGLERACKVREPAVVGVPFKHMLSCPVM